MADYVFIGDDFTGASDTLATLAERGRAVRLFLDAPTPEEAAGLDAVGIATDLRARSPREIAARLAALAPAVRRLEPRLLHYKVCSTFDSAPHVGSVGAAVTALEAALTPAHTLILGGQPSLGRYSLFGTLFAKGPDGKVHRIDRHPVMSRHPVTPMDEADLRLQLARQGLEAVALVDRGALRDGGALAGRLAGPGRTLVDAVDQGDVEAFGAALRGTVAGAPLLIVGASGVAEAIAGRAAMVAAGAPPVQGPRLVVAGSRSSATAAQVAAAVSYERIAVDPEHLDAEGAERLVRRCAELLAAGRDVLVHLRPDGDYGMPSNMLSERLAGLAAAIVALRSPGAVGVAGGDTSSAVVERLGFRSLSFAGRAGAGVAVCRGHAPGRAVDGMVLLLKGGQVGGVEVFERFGMG